jgi:hypothetical protein
MHSKKKIGKKFDQFLLVEAIADGGWGVQAGIGIIFIHF